MTSFIWSWRPFGAFHFAVVHSQGVALGCNIFAPSVLGHHTIYCFGFGDTGGRGG